MPLISFYTPHETSENQKFFDVVREYRNTRGMEWINLSDMLLISGYFDSDSFYYNHNQDLAMHGGTGKYICLLPSHTTYAMTNTTGTTIQYLRST